MKSIGDVKRLLPQDFTEYIYENYSSAAADKIIKGMGTKRDTTLRVNTIKTDILSIIEYFKKINIKFDRMEWLKEAMIIKNADEKKLLGMDITKEGLIYIQSLSSMIPSIVLNPKPNERILDVAAAPGSKTTQMAAMMENKGYILANEIDSIRLQRLKFNLDVQGVKIVETCNLRGESLKDIYINNFDKVLLDVPCSGEGRFNVYDKRTYCSWSLGEIKKLSKLQKKLLSSAYEALKKDGTMVYSTCTLNYNENEEVIKWGINNLGLKVLPIDIKIPFNSRIESPINGCLKIMPSQLMEGFFVCHLKKL